MKKKTLYGIIALIIAAAIVIVAGIGSSVNGKWFKNKDIQTWFNSWGQNSSKEENPPTGQANTWGGVVDDIGNDMNATTTYAMPAAMAFYATVSEDVIQKTRLAAPSVTVTCSHNFEFNNVFVDWSVEYPNGESAADIATVTPASDGSLKATLTCLGAFSEPLTLKATLRGNSTKTATCKIDYIKRIVNVTEFYMAGNDFGDDINFYMKPVYGTGTVQPYLYLNNITYKLQDSFKTAVQSYLKFDVNFKNYSAHDDLVHTPPQSSYCMFENGIWEYSMFIEDFDEFDEAHQNAIYYAWRTAYFEHFNGQSNIYFDVNISVGYNSVKVDGFEDYDFLGEGAHINYLSGDSYGDGLYPDLTLNGNIAL